MPSEAENALQTAVDATDEQARGEALKRALAAAKTLGMTPEVLVN